MPSRREALALLHENVKSESLRKHCLAVAVAMEDYAKKYNLSEEEQDKFWITGLLHDFDYEKYPDINIHPKEGCKILEEKGYGKEIIQAVLGHNEKTGVKRESLMAKCLFAVDELCGLIVALAYVRPGKFDGMKAESVKKVMKKKDFAKNVNRDDIKQGMMELNVPEEEHFELVISSLKGISKSLFN